METGGSSSVKRITKQWRFLRPAKRSSPLAHHFQDTSENRDAGIRRITSVGVKCGELSSLFREAPAVILHRDDRINRLVDSTLDWLGLANGSAGDSFDSNLFDLARNHRSGNVRVGDILRFMPKVFGHIARKFVVYPGAGDSSPQAWPRAFYSGNRRVPVPQDIVESAWNLMSEVLMSALPAQAGSLAYAVEVDVLVYPTSSFDVSRTHALLADSTGFWSQLGHRIDARKDHANGLFQRKGIRDLFGIASLIPGFGGLLSALNERMSVVGEDSTPKDHYVIASAHVDDTRYITGLMGLRENLDTEIRWEERWISLPVTADAIALFPSARITSLTDISATRHRVLVHDIPDGEGTPTRNITVSLAIVDPLPAILPAD